MEKELFIRPFTLDNKASGESLNLSVFKGTISFAVFTKGGGKPPIKINVTPYLYEVLKSAFNKIRKAAPETKIPVKKEKFNPETKQWALEWVLTFSKDAEMLYHVTLTNCLDGNRTFDFVFRGTGGISIGSDPMSNADKSAFAFETMIEWFERTMLAVIWTDEKYDPNRHGGNGGGNYNGGNSFRGGNSYGGNNGGNGGGSGNSDDDIPF